jgi:hypothetical protein
MNDRATPIYEYLLLGFFSVFCVVLVVGLAGEPWASDWFTKDTLSFEMAKGIPAGLSP